MQWLGSTDGPRRGRSLAAAALDGLPRVAIAAIAGLAVAIAASGQETAGETPAPQASAATAPAAPESEEARARLGQIEQQIARLEANAADWTQRGQGYEQARAAAPERMAALEAELKRLDRAEPDAPEPNASLEELEATLIDAEQDLALARKQETSLEADLSRRPERRKKIPELLASAKQRLKELADEPPPPAEAEPSLAEARQRLSQIRTASLEREIEAFQAELLSFDVRGQLLRKEFDVSERRVAAADERVESLRELVRGKQESEAQQDAERARQTAREALSLPAAVQDLASQLAQQNERLADRRSGEDGLPVKIDELRRKLARADEHIAKLDADFERLIEKVEAAGLSDSIGLLLRKQRAEVPDVGKYRRFIRMRQELITDVQLEQIEWREQRRQLAKIEHIIDKAMAELDASVNEADRERIEEMLRELLETKREYVDALISDFETYFQKLVDFDARQHELIVKAEELLLFIDQRVLWVPSSEVLRPTLPNDTWDATTWLLSPSYTGQLLRALGQIVTQAPLLSATVAIALASFLALRGRVRRRLTALSEEACEPTCTRDAATWEAAGLSLLLAPWFPGLLAYVGWQLSLSPDATQYVRCVAYGALSAALVWISLEVPRQLLRRGGLFPAHFGAPPDATASLRRQLGLLTIIAVPAVFIIQIFEMRGEDLWRESLGRFAFLVVMLSVVIVMHALMREPKGALWAIVKQPFQTGVRPWVQRLSHGVTVAFGVVLILGAVRGYYWTVLKLAASFHFTLIFLLLLLVLYRLFVRWSLLARRRLAFEQLEAAGGRTTEGSGDYEGIDLEPGVDLAVVDAQTGRLVKGVTAVAFLLGMWLIWSDLLPAVGILREVELWTSTGAVTVELTNAAGERSFSVEDRILPVTLADLLLALILAAMTLVTVRNLPGFLEITILRHLAAGERYAYATIAKYLVTLIGVAVAFNAIGIGWSNIQWLVAAVGLGLGFGLQEIFANFISGLIILFERPIRVGDTVTIGNISGVVSRIRIRATWITAFDRKELVVPNKEFVTTQLINWSLSDAVSRIEIKVGIAYGSDTERAIELLREIGGANPDALKEPPPHVFFLGFGESSLDFELRVFSPDVEHRLPIVHALHMAIDKAFREAGIEIAFPQRDLHVRSLPANDGGEEQG